MSGKTVVLKIDERVSDDFTSFLEERIKESGERYVSDYPVVYIHNYHQGDGKNVVYIGESNDVVSRTKTHYNDRRDPSTWQNKMLVDGRELQMYVVGHEHFNKSLTLDVENRLIHYMSSMGNVDNVNGRSNAQKNYYPVEEFDKIFSDIWKKLRKMDKDLFLSESIIRDSAIFKASPLHKLTIEQYQAKEFILQRIDEAVENKLDDQLIIVEGEAGTGKTVLTSSTFYEIMERNEDANSKKLRCCLLVNHDEQITVYEELARKLNLKNEDGTDVVSKPTHFINTHDPNNKIDVAFVDEAHLLLTQGKQSYNGNNQLEDIVKRARVTVIMFDENQILTTEEFWEAEQLLEIRKKSKEQDNYFQLTKQLRMIANKDTIEWIDGITIDRKIGELHLDRNYEIKCFDTPEDLYEAICIKAENEDTRLSRLIATYDWEYSNVHRPKNKKYWSVKIGDFEMPWNRELSKELSRKEKRANKKLAWAEQPQTIHEIGSTFTIQGFDLSYAGVIIGPSVRYRDGRIEFVPGNSFNEKAVRNRTLLDGTKKSFGEDLLRHELRILMTRGVRGLYIYAVDDELREALKQSIERLDFIRESE